MKSMLTLLLWPLVWAGSATAASQPAVLTTLGQTPDKVFAEHFVIFPPVGDDQVQVVYMRPREGIQRPGSAHIYVNREFHTGLLPGGYTRFCLAPGTYTLGSYLNDAPRYAGKRTDLYEATLKGGITYYLKVRESDDTTPLAITREQALSQLKEVRAQAHALSRVSVVEPCRYYDHLEETRKDYTLSSDVLFSFGKSAPGDLSATGRAAIAHWLKELQRDDVQISHIEVIGHTDPIGHEADNQLLGLRRANTVSEILIEQGLPESLISVSSAGNREPLVHSCYGTREQQVACYAPNRRVVLRVDKQRQNL